MTVHRGGKTFQQKRRKAEGEPGAKERPPAKLDDEAKAAVTAGLDPGDFDALPAEARPAQSTLDKAKDLALTVAARALTWLHRFNESQLGQLAIKGLDALFDGPEDMKKLGYNPNNTSGTANPQTSDAVRHALEAHLGFGVSGHLVARIAANVLAHVWTRVKRAATGAAEEAFDPKAEWADLISQLLAHLAEQYKTGGAPDKATVLKALEAL